MALKWCTCGEACFSCGDTVCDNCGDKASNYTIIDKGCPVDKEERNTLLLRDMMKMANVGTVVAEVFNSSIKTHPPATPRATSECTGCQKPLTDFTCRDRDIFFDLGMCFDCSENNNNNHMMFH